MSRPVPDLSSNTGGECHAGDDLVGGRLIVFPLTAPQLSPPLPPRYLPQGHLTSLSLEITLVLHGNRLL